MVCDQKGSLVYFTIAEGGQTMKDIRDFLDETADHLPVQVKPIIYCDNLTSHVSLSKMRSLKFELRLTPLSTPDSNIIETLFGSIKAHVTASLIEKYHTMKIQQWIAHCNKVLSDWHNCYDGDWKLLDYSMEFLKSLIKYDGDLQQVAFQKAGYSSSQDMKMVKLDCDVNIV